MLYAKHKAILDIKKIKTYTRTHTNIGRETGTSMLGFHLQSNIEEQHIIIPSTFLDTLCKWIVARRRSFNKRQRRPKLLKPNRTRHSPKGNGNANGIGVQSVDNNNVEPKMSWDRSGLTTGEWRPATGYWRRSPQTVKFYICTCNAHCRNFDEPCVAYN